MPGAVATLAPDLRPGAAAGPGADPVGLRSTTELVEAARAHDVAAWRELVRRYDGCVRRAVAGHRMRPADSADAVQNTWLRAVERLHTVHDPERFGGWLRTTARRECLDLLRRLNREGPGEIDMEEVPGAGPGPEGAVLDGEAHDVLAAAVDRLPDRRRRLIRALFYRPEYPYARMAREFGLPIGSIGPTRRRALETLRSELDRIGYLDSRAPV
jgi:RNA polymerase sigma factor (sigma-70 family)